MDTKVSYETICACKSDDQEALRTILKHYVPLIVQASKQVVNTPDGDKIVIVNQDLKAYIESELVMRILTKYDLSRIPREKIV